MASRKPSDLEILLKLLRRIIVLAVAAFGLLRGMPYIALALRVAALWAILYICSGIVDIVFRRLSLRATMIEQSNGLSSAPEPHLPVVKKEPVR